MARGLDALRRWKKCQRRVSNAALKSALSATPKKLRGLKRAELSRVANVLASVACSKGTKQKTRRRASTRVARPHAAKPRSVIPSDYFSRTRHVPGFAPYRPPRREKPLFNPEVSY